MELLVASVKDMNITALGPNNMSRRKIPQKKSFKKGLTNSGHSAILTMSERQGHGETTEAHVSDVSPDKTLKYRVKFTGTVPAGADGKGRQPTP